jgi:LuxR family maltose regulon positive regulatory protein
MAVVNEQAATVGQVWLATGSAQAAVNLLAAQAEVARQAGQLSPWLRLEALRIVALDAAGRRPEALGALREALRMAEAEGYVRVFLDLGEPMARLLRLCCNQGICVGYSASLLAAFPSGTEPAPLSASPASLAEPLSRREEEILRLLASEATHAEIARQCFITTNTLKKHLSNIYGKLGVSARHQAVERARKLKIL